MTDHAANKQKNTQNKTAHHKPNPQLNQQPNDKQLSDKQLSDKPLAEQKSHRPSTRQSVLKPSIPQPAMKMVDIMIAGITYNIYCPINEENELQSAVEHINKFAMNLRKEAPNLSQENLLLLCCLNLYEKSNHNKTPDDSATPKQTDALLKKIIHDAQSILG